MAAINEEQEEKKIKYVLFKKWNVLENIDRTKILIVPSLIYMF